jgi:hypothetical protein
MENEKKTLLKCYGTFSILIEMRRGEKRVSLALFGMDNVDKHGISRRKRSGEVLNIYDKQLARFTPRAPFSSSSISILLMRMKWVKAEKSLLILCLSRKITDENVPYELFASASFFFCPLSGWSERIA